MEFTICNYNNIVQTVSLTLKISNTYERFDDNFVFLILINCRFCLFGRRKQVQF